MALAQEGAELRDAGIDGRILVLSEQPPELLREALRDSTWSRPHRLQPRRSSTCAGRAAGACDHPVHLKIDTGMHRCRGYRAEEALERSRQPSSAARRRRLVGVLTHLAVADDPQHDYTAGQLAAFGRVLAEIGAAGIVVEEVHAANSAGALAHSQSRASFVRSGIALYGVSPGSGVDHLSTGLRPAMSLRARVSFVKRVPVGTGMSYGLRHTFPGRGHGRRSPPCRLG